MDNVLELPQFKERKCNKNCDLKKKFNSAVHLAMGETTRKQNRTNFIMYFLIMALAVCCLGQAVQIYGLEHNKPKANIVVEQSLDNMQPVKLEELR